MGKLRLIRGNEWFGRALELRVFVDGVEVGTVKFNDYKDFYVSKGKHEVYTVMDNLKSKKFNIEIEESKPSMFRVRLPTFTDNVFSLLATFVDGGDSITFDPISTDTRADNY